MRLDNMPSEFQEALPVLKKIKEAGFEAYFVGGSVRDALLERPIHDVDIASSAYPEEIKKIFPRTIDVGIEHGTVLVLENNGEYEVTTFRTEDVYVDYRRPSKVSFVRSLEEDLKRRDFTINALALDEKGQVIDLFQGLADLEQRLLRAVGQAAERFNEDALRIMRGFRFQASLGFDLEADTLRAMRDCAPLLEKISVERLFVEFDKLLMGVYWRKGLAALLSSGASDFLPDMKGRAQQLTQLFDLQPDFAFSSSEQAWAALVTALDVHDIRSFLKDWKTSKEFAKKVAALAEIAAIRRTRELTRRDCYRYESDLLLQAEHLRQAAGLPVDFELIRTTHSSLAIHGKHEMAVSGRLLIEDYGFQPGPALGQVLNQVETAIVDGILANDRDDIIEFIKELGYE
ncbi:CCA tRNA nucleotidyltransferase [Streptococcus panodentis]|uniref:CCA-adding enzyme n=1 Tax=Streptococcus panodentis TaxID=1581472 RepID=A0ABS5ATF5_9STRE|nr:CCA tRNA nucleotidyltransferase [Streptococcus panodentis]MBP2619855.1 CCA tRNA nucleotidyltransferase [Streptococcus panodentis]